MATHNTRQTGRSVDHPRPGDICLIDMKPAESALGLRSAVLLNRIHSVDQAVQISLGLVTL
jgi:hypothetical protein